MQRRLVFACVLVVVVVVVWAGLLSDFLCTEFAFFKIFNGFFFFVFFCKAVNEEALSQNVNPIKTPC